MNLIQGLYSLGLKVDRSLTKSIKLSCPVISVGNISVGGRAKTPLVIDICHILKEAGLAPVVLTRGYARKINEDFWLLPEIIPNLQHVSVDACGDEALEIFLTAKVPVLVSSKRFLQAEKFLQRYKDGNYVFVLDDGFQHWKLERDLDLVVVHENDHLDSLLPTGRLRETKRALERADFILHLDADLQKKIQLSLFAHHLDPSTCVALTTRAGSQKHYHEELCKELGFKILIKNYKDHLESGELKNEILKLPPGVTQLLVGMKEAVKLLGPVQFLENTLFHKLEIQGRSFEVYLVKLKLEWDRGHFKKLLREKGICH